MKNLIGIKKGDVSYISLTESYFPVSLTDIEVVKLNVVTISFNNGKEIEKYFENYDDAFRFANEVAEVCNLEVVYGQN